MDAEFLVFKKDYFQISSRAGMPIAVNSRCSSFESDRKKPDLGYFQDEIGFELPKNLPEIQLMGF